MFILLPLLRPGDTLGFTCACETAAVGEVPAQYRITVTPKLVIGASGGQTLNLNRSLVVTGSLAEMAAELIPTLTRYQTSTAAARNSIDEVEAAHRAIRATAKGKPPVAKPAPAIKGEPETEPEVEPAPAPTKPTPKPKTAEAATPSLI